MGGWYLGKPYLARILKTAQNIVRSLSLLLLYVCIFTFTKNIQQYCKNSQLQVLGNQEYLIVMVLESQKNQTSWHILLDYFTTRPSFKKLNVAFLTIDYKNL